MTFVLDPSRVGEVAAMPAVRDAAESGMRLIELWPLTEAGQMENDAKYGENLQVRITRTMASVMTGLDVTMPDAEFVYEGADEIPGRPQEIVDALLAANDAYDTTAGYSESGDIREPLAAAARLDVQWDPDAVDAVSDVWTRIERVAAPDAETDGRLDAADGVDAAAQRFATVLVALDATLDALEAGQGRSLADTLPVLLWANELCERLSVPRLYVDAHQWKGVVDAHAQGGVHAIAELIAPLAKDEWNRHREDVLWDPAEAKKKAREEDERKSKEALAAKFAHVKNDNQKTVEL